MLRPCSQGQARARLDEYLSTPRCSPLFVVGDARAILERFPSETFDCCMTSPPYWGKRDYSGGGIGLEADYRDFVRNLSAVCAEVERVLKPTGSFWLNRKSVGIDVSSEYIELAEQRTATLSIAGPADEFLNNEFYGNAGSGEAAFDG